MSLPDENLQNCHGSAVPVLTTPPPKVPTQNTPKQSWEANRKVWKAYADLGWFKNQEIEPYMPNNGKSILVRWLNEDDKGISWTCCAPLDNEEHGCGHEPFRRLDRAIAHVRGHLGLEPFPCKEGCGNEGCDKRFDSSEKLSVHRKGPIYLNCDICGAQELRQNMPRHKQYYCPRSGQTEEAI